MRALRILLLSLIPSFAFVSGGCSVEQELGQSEDFAQATLPFQVVEGVHKSNAPEGVTVIKTKAAYKSFFGTNPPAGVSFSKSWLVHVSLGIRNTGGYAVEVERIDKVPASGGKYTLTVHATEHAPGEGCIVTFALTNPQVAVLINKQPSTSTVASFDHVLDVNDCNAEEPTFCGGFGNFPCPEEGQVCVDDPSDDCDPENGGADCGGVCVVDELE